MCLVCDEQKGVGLEMGHATEEVLQSRQTVAGVSDGAQFHILGVTQMGLADTIFAGIFYSLLLDVSKPRVRRKNEFVSLFH